MRIAALLLASALPLSAQAKFEMWPGATYDPAVPTPKKVLGYDFGDRVSSHANIVKYMNALAAAEPNRIKVFEYGKTWEGRELIYAVIGSEANIKRLPEIRAAMERLHDPRKTPPAEAQRLIANMPAILWLAYSVHGNEISGSDAALVTAYHLLASRNDKAVSDAIGKCADHHRADTESRRTQPLHSRLRSGRGSRTGREPSCRRAQRIVARRTHQPLLLRSQSRLAGHHAARDHRPCESAAGMESAGLHRPARDGH